MSRWQGTNQSLDPVASPLPLDPHFAGLPTPPPQEGIHERALMDLVRRGHPGQRGIGIGADGYLDNDEPGCYCNVVPAASALAVSVESSISLGRNRLQAELPYLTRGCFYIRILVQGQGGSEFSAAGILAYFEDWKRGPDAEMGPIDNVESAHSGPFLAQ